MHAQKKTKHALTLLCSANHLFACHITTESHTQLYIHSATKITLEHLELELLTIFNPTRIAQQINQLYATFNLNRDTTPLLIGLYGPAVKDEYLSLPYAHPNINQLPLSYAPHWQWNYCYLYPHDHAYYFYLCGIPRELILQFKLLSLQHTWNLQYLTSERMALLQLYPYLFGSAFRPAQFGLHMQQKNNRIDALYSRDDLSRIAHLSSNIPIVDHDVGSLLASCGLFVAGVSDA